MKVVVMNEFNDKYTKEPYKVGDELNIPVERVNEILSAGNYLIRIVEQTEVTTEEVETEQSEPLTEQEVEQSETAGKKKRTK